MEIAEVNLISDFEAGIKCLQNNPSLIPQLSLTHKITFWTYGALIFAVFATFTNIINQIKAFLHHTLLKPLLSYHNSYPQHIFTDNVDSDFGFDFSSDDEDLDTPSSVADSDDDDEDEHSEVFLFRSEGDGCHWNNNNNNEGQNGHFSSFNNLSLRRRNGRTDEVFRGDGYFNNYEGQSGNFSSSNNVTIRRRNVRVDEAFREENDNNEGQIGNFTSLNNLSMRRRANGEGQNSNYSRTNEVFRANGEGQNSNYSNLNNLTLRRRNGCSWSDFSAGKNVVQLWDGLGLGLDFEDNDNNIVLWDMDREVRLRSGRRVTVETVAETVVLTAEVDGVNGGVGFGTYDSRVDETYPAIYATWRPRQRQM